MSQTMEFRTRNAFQCGYRHGVLAPMEQALPSVWLRPNEQPASVVAAFWRGHQQALADHATVETLRKRYA